MKMKSTIKMAMFAVSAVFVMMASVASASDTDEFRGYTGCDRAIDGAQDALELALSAADLPSDDLSRDRKWRIAMEYNQACYDVVRASCGSADGFHRPPATQSSISLCQDMLDGGYQAKVGLTTQKFDSEMLAPGINMVTAVINIKFFDAENATVEFSSDCTSTPETGCESINTGGEDAEIHILNGWGSASDVISCPSSTRDFDDEPMKLGDLMRDIPAHRNRFVDEEKLNCTFFSAQPFSVKVVPKG